MLNHTSVDVQHSVLYTLSKDKGVHSMFAINYTNLRDNMKTYLDKVTDEFETLIVTRKDNKNVVILSQEAYNNLLENAHITASKENYDWLMESKKQLETGNMKKRELIDE